MDIPVPSQRDVEQISESCPHVKRPDVAPCADCQKQREAAVNSDFSRIVGKYAQATKESMERLIEKVAMLSSELEQRYGDIVTASGQRSISARQCAHVSHPPVQPCHDCLKARTERLRTDIYNGASVYGREEAKRAKTDTSSQEATITMLTERLRGAEVELASKNTIIKQLEARIIKQKDEAAELEIIEKAERAAAAGYVVGPMVMLDE